MYYYILNHQDMSGECFESFNRIYRCVRYTSQRPSGNIDMFVEIIMPLQLLAPPLA
jgi:hypothetical protein